MNLRSEKPEMMEEMTVRVLSCPRLSSRLGQRRHPCDDAGLQHAEGSLLQVAEEQERSAPGGRAHRLVRVHQELPQSQSKADM